MTAKILCVDDDPLILAAFSRLLQKSYDIHTAHDAAEAMDTIKEDGPFAVIISDRCMPGMNGFDFLRAAREIAPDSVTILLTGNCEPQAAGEESGHDHIFRIIPKPFDFIKLKEVLASAVIQYGSLSSAERAVGTIE